MRQHRPVLGLQPSAVTLHGIEFLKGILQLAFPFSLKGKKNMNKERIKLQTKYFILQFGQHSLLIRMVSPAHPPRSLWNLPTPGVPLSHHMLWYVLTQNILSSSLALRSEQTSKPSSDPVQKFHTLQSTWGKTGVVALLKAKHYRELRARLGWWLRCVLRFGQFLHPSLQSFSKNFGLPIVE